MSHEDVKSLVNWPGEISEEFTQRLSAIGEVKSNVSSLGVFPNLDRFRGVGYFIEGVAAMYTIGDDDKLIFGGLTGRGDWFGAKGFQDDTWQPVYAEEILPVKFVLFSDAKIKQLQTEYPETYKWLYIITCMSTPRWLQTYIIATYDKEIQVIYTLLNLLGYFSTSTDDPPKIMISQEKLSLTTQVSRPRVNEVLKTLEKEALIKVERNAIYFLDLAALKQRLDHVILFFIDPRKRLD